MNTQTFYFHYDRALSKEKNEMWLKVHFGTKCYIVRKVICNVPIESIERETQPRCIMMGLCEKIVVKDKTAYIS